MAIIEKCCCCGWTLRTGCYVSATFSLIYFFIFTWITGSLTIVRISYIFSPETYENKSHFGGSYEEGFHAGAVLHQHEPQNQQHVIDRVSPVTSLPSKSSSSLSSAKRMENGLENNISERISTISASDPSVQLKNQADGSNSLLEVFLYSEAYSILQTVNLVLDLLCEIAGVYASILLIRALQQERKSWFWPWMIVVPLHIAIDAFTISGIMMEHFVNPNPNQIPLVVITFFVDVTLNSINAYGLLCVISQYQEYKAGRGTAAYVEFTLQTPAIMLETASSTKTVLTKPNSLSPSNPRRSKDFSSSRALCNDKSDTYCEEFSLQTLTNPNDKQSLTEENCQGRNENINKVQNRQGILTFKVDENDSGATPDSHDYNHVNEVSWIEAPSNKPIPEVRRNSTKFGKLLDVHRGKGGRKQSNAGSDESEELHSVKVIPSRKNSQSALLNNKSKIGWYDNEQSSITKSDSDSEDATDDVLSAFGIISNGRN